MMKKTMKKKLLIPLVAAACMMYGCSSQPVSSTETEITTEVQSEETSTEEPTNKETETEESKAEESKTGQENEQNTEPEENDESSSGNEDDGKDKENTEDKSDDASEEKEDKDKDTADKKDESSEEDSEEENAKKDKFIQTVKKAHPESFSGCTYGNAFDEFFTSPQWTYFESTDGRDVVEFTGECIYAGAPTKTKMQFIISKENPVVTPGALYYNNTPQNTKTITESLNRIFEQYAKAHDIAYTLPSTEAAKTSQTNALPPETQAETTAPQDQDKQEQNTESQTSEEGTTQNQDTQNQNTKTQNAQDKNTQTPNSSETAAVNSGNAQAALEFAAWTNPKIGSWHSPSTGYYIIPYIDSTGNPSLRFASENTRADSAAVYYTDAVSATANDAGGLTYQAYLYKASKENPQLVGMVEASWNSAADLKSLSIKMINGNQAMDNSMAGNDYAYFGAVD